MVSSQISAEIHRRLHRIETLATEIEEVPNFGPDLWTMRKVDKKCQEIREHCQWIAQQAFFGTGSGHSTPPGGTGPGY